MADNEIYKFERSIISRMERLTKQADKTVQPETMLLLRGKLDALRAVHAEYVKHFGIQPSVNTDSYAI